MISPQDLAGPVAALVLALYVVRELWRAHEKSDQDIRDQRDAAMAGWAGQTAATDKLAAAVEARARDGEGRRRHADGA